MQLKPAHSAISLLFLQWLNSILEQMWPFYDPAICEAVKVRCRMAWSPDLSLLFLNFCMPTEQLHSASTCVR
jgi:hypothetical protein